MLLLIFLISSIHFLLSVGVPVTPAAATEASFNDDVSPHATNYRSTIQILWTCWAVIVASTWVCIHAHVPGYDAKHWHRWGIRGRLFLNALLFPDVFVTRAFREWMGARAVDQEMKKRLSGLKLEPGKPTGAKPAEAAEIKARELEDHVRRLLEEAEQLREAGQLEKEVERLKTESTRLDTEWRKLRLSIDKQLKGRGTKELEGSGEQTGLSLGQWTIVHAHFIHMGGIVFKGPNGHFSFKDFSKWTDDDISGFFALELSRAELQDRSKADALAKAFVIIQCLWFVVECIGRTASGLPLLELEVTCLAYIACNVGMYGFWWHKPLNVACPEVILSATEAEAPDTATPRREGYVTIWGWLLAFLQTLDSGDIGLVIFPSRGLDEEINQPSKRFPVNYYRKIEGCSLLVDGLSQMAPLAIFGALHAIAWSFTFPSPTEQFLWQASSVTPAALAVTRTVLILATEHLRGRWALKLWFGVGFAISGIIVAACFAARVAFLVLPLFQFRDLPPLTHQTVPWSDFFPHV